ncbi:MAG: hypothetical protein KDD37_11295 [Bdellovibrionales bacterium]|nr:hypothetical protein [Bdellovibrionales bacterium]
MVLLVIFLAFSQTVTTSPLISNFEEQWRAHVRTPTVSKVQITNWTNQIWERAKYKTPADKEKLEASRAYQDDRLYKLIVTLQSKGVDNSEAVKELIKTYIMLQEARVRYTLDPTSSDLYLAIERYNKMFSSFDTAIFSYDIEGKYKKGWFDGAFDVAKLKSEFAGGWSYDVRHVSYLTPDAPKDNNMPSDEDLMTYNKVYCQCFFDGKRNVDLLKKCVAESISGDRGCFLSSNQNEQPKARRIGECGSGRVFIFPFGTQYFLNSSCTLDLARAKSFLVQNKPKAGASSGAR